MSRECQDGNCLAHLLASFNSGSSNAQDAAKVFAGVEVGNTREAGSREAPSFDPADSMLDPRSAARDRGLMLA